MSLELGVRNEGCALVNPIRSLSKLLLLMMDNGCRAMKLVLLDRTRDVFNGFLLRFHSLTS